MTYISWSSDFSSFIFCSETHFSFIGKAQFRRATLSCDSSYLLYVRCKSGVTFIWSCFRDVQISLFQICIRDISFSYKIKISTFKIERSVFQLQISVFKNNN